MPVALPPDRADYYRDMENLVGSHGWGRLTRAIEDEVRDLKETALLSCKDAGDLAYRRGMVNVLERMLRLADTIHEQREADEAPLPDESGHLYEG